MRCQVCGRIKRGSKEHVIPSWARQALGEPIDDRIPDSPREDASTPVSERANLDLVLDGKICQRCSSDSFADLERLVEPILKPMAADCTATLIGTAGQRLLSTWAVKTLFMIELAVQQSPAGRSMDGFTPSRSELSWVWNESHPPPRSKVWLACFDPQETTKIMYEPLAAPLLNAQGTQVDGGRFTSFSLGHVAFQVFAIDFVEADEKRATEFRPPTPPEPVASALAQIWPARPKALPWPQPAFGHRDWNKLVTWDGSLRTSA